jgi:hypothetical protein
MRRLFYWVAGEGPLPTKPKHSSCVILNLLQDDTPRSRLSLEQIQDGFGPNVKGLG